MLLNLSSANAPSPGNSFSSWILTWRYLFLYSCKDISLGLDHYFCMTFILVRLALGLKYINFKFSYAWSKSASGSLDKLSIAVKKFCSWKPSKMVERNTLNSSLLHIGTSFTTNLPFAICISKAYKLSSLRGFKAIVQVLPVLVDAELVLCLKLNFVSKAPKSSAATLLSNGIGHTYRSFLSMIVAVAAILIFIISFFFFYYFF